MDTLIHNGYADICDDIIDCLAEHGKLIEGDNRDQKMIFAGEYFRDAMLSTGGFPDTPTEESIKNVLKLLAARELKTGKDTRIISENFIRIAKRLNR